MTWLETNQMIEAAGRMIAMAAFVVLLVGIAIASVLDWLGVPSYTWEGFKREVLGIRGRK